jgi:PAS domain S-box-containing protein
MDVGKYGSSEFLGHLIGGMVEGVIFIDDENIVQLCNPVGGIIRSVKGEEIVGKPFLECHPERVYKNVLAVVEELKAEGKRELNRTVRFKERYFEHSYSAVRDGDGRYLGIVAVSRDITTRRSLEKKLTEHAKELERSNQIKDLFSDIMSHDFINPSSVILNLADLLLDEEELGEDVENDVMRIKHSAERLVEMIEDARKFSKLEDIGEIAFNETDLKALLEKSIQDFQHILEEKNQRVIWKSDQKSIARVSHFIEDVFSNLLSNAIKYSPEGSEIVVGVENKSGSALISVADQAEKIPKEYQNSIFERFKRLGKESVKGTGLGLAIVKRVIELHNGRVWVEDNPDGGNIFYVETPKKNKK